MCECVYLVSIMLFKRSLSCEEAIDTVISSLLANNLWVHVWGMFILDYNVCCVGWYVTKCVLLIAVTKRALSNVFLLCMRVVWSYGISIMSFKRLRSCILHLTQAKWPRPQQLCQTLLQVVLSLICVYVCVSRYIHVNQTPIVICTFIDSASVKNQNLQTFQ